MSNGSALTDTSDSPRGVVPNWPRLPASPVSRLRRRGVLASVWWWAMRCSCRLRSRLAMGSGRDRSVAGQTAPAPSWGQGSWPLGQCQFVAEVAEGLADGDGHVLIADALEAGMDQLQGAGAGGPAYLPVKPQLGGEARGVIAAGLQVSVHSLVSGLLVVDLPWRRPHPVAGGRQLLAVDPDDYHGAPVGIERRLHGLGESVHLGVEHDLPARRRLRRGQEVDGHVRLDRKSTRLNSSHVAISYAVFCLKKK